MNLKIYCILVFLLTGTAKAVSSAQAVAPTFDETGCTRELITASSANFTCLNEWTVSTFKELNCHIEFVLPILPERKLRMLRRGNLDFATGLSKTPQREENLFFSEPIHHTLFSIFGSADTGDHPITEICDEAMANRHLIIPEGYFISDEVESALNDKSCYKTLQRTPMSGKTALEMLLAGRAEIIILPQNYLAAAGLSDKFSSTLFRHPVIIEGKPAHIALSRRTMSEYDVEKLNTVLTNDKLMQLKQCLSGGIDKKYVIHRNPYCATN